jgi:hypothetical protein
VLGAPTARQAVPSAFLREFAAVLVMHRWWHLAAVATIVVLWSVGLWSVGLAIAGPPR